MTATAWLEVRALRRLDGFALDVEFGSPRGRTVLFGPSGGGKSLTLRAVAGAFRLDAGRIALGGTVLYDGAARVDLPAHARRVGYVPQGYALFPHLTVAQNVLYGARAREKDRQKLLQDLLALTDLTGLDSRRPRELSGGQQQRVALARALASEPELLLLDEPFSALDASRRRALRDEVIEVQKRTGVPLVVVTHDLQDAFEIGDQIVVIDAGRVLQQGPREELFYRPNSRRVAALVGMRNLFEARVRSRGEGALLCEWHGRVLESASPLLLAPGDPVTLGVRPAQMTVRRAEESFAGRPNVVGGRIVAEVVTPEGYRLTFMPDRGEGASFEIELSGYTYFRLGLDARKEIEVSIRPDALHAIA